MKIGVNCYLLRSDVGGVKQYFLSLFRELLASDLNNEYIFFYFKENRKELEKLGCQVLEKQGVLLASQRDIKEHLNQVDLYFCPFGSLIPRPLSLPTVVTVHDIQEVFFPDFFTFHNLVARFWHFVGSTKMADQVISISKFTKETLIEHHRLPAEKVTVAHSCADQRFYRAKEIARCPDQPLPRQFVFFPANRWAHKNHDTLLQALAWLRTNHRITVHAVFTGYDQENGYSVEKKAKEYGVSEQVVQLGYVSVEELAYLYTHSLCMVFPSLFEGFGIPVVEAMACGCPVLASNTTSLPEVGGDAFLPFDPTSHEELAATLLSFINNPELRNTLQEKGYQRASQFSAAATARAHMKAFTAARENYSGKQYLYLRFGYKYAHAFKTLLRAAGLTPRLILSRNKT